jgi:hypothetical protein
MWAGAHPLHQSEREILRASVLPLYQSEKERERERERENAGVRTPSLLLRERERDVERGY